MSKHWVDGVTATALVTEDEQYRYVLTRLWAPALPVCTFIMLNPSMADAHIDDMTLRKCQGYSRRWGYGSLIVVNLFALRATDPAQGGHMGRDKIVETMVRQHGRPLYRIGPPTPLRSMPRHPGRLSYELELERHG